MSLDPAPVPAGALLVATPELLDPNFSRTVVLVLASDSSGALGLVVNRATEVPLDAVLPQWPGPTSDPGVVFVGGPVSPGGAIALGLVPSGWERGPDAAPRQDGSGGHSDRRGSPAVGEPRLFGGRLGTVDLSHEAADGDPSPRTGDDAGPVAALQSLRVFAGYAGWGAAQLEAEVATGSWFVVPALPDDAFDPDPATLWRRVLRRQGSPIALVSTYPEDAGQN